MATGDFDIERVNAENARVRADTRAMLERVRPERRDEVVDGEWRLRDIVAHLAGAQSGYAEALEHVAAGEPPSIAEYGPPGPPHEWNSRVVARSQGRSWDQLLEDLDAAQTRHEAAVRACGAALGGDERSRFYAQNVVRHESGHLAGIRRWLAGESVARPTAP
ncbi:MAG: hypothetical protein GEU80_17660 [Dehalococcoidia bacterium]|nr:hypothetical protein [Dehalococcoidia bacterium]